MSANDLRLGQSAVVEMLNGDVKLTKRLKALGYIEGTKITLKAQAPLGDPVILNLRGFDMALRRKDAQNIIVKEIKR